MNAASVHGRYDMEFYRQESYEDVYKRPFMNIVELSLQVWSKTSLHTFEHMLL
jgi:hypothetical protein